MSTKQFSLKAVIPTFAKVFGMTADSLYERQRALVRAGLLEAKGGRGPGSGVRATPQSLAMFLIAVLAGGELSETEERTNGVAKLKSRSKLCPLTGERTFAAALSAVLGSEEFAKKARVIEIERSGSNATARLAFQREPEKSRVEKRWESSEFGSSLSDARHSAALTTKTSIGLRFVALAQIASIIEEPE